MTHASVILDGRLLHRPVSGLERYVSSLAEGLRRCRPEAAVSLSVEWPNRVSASLSARCNVISVYNERHLVEVVKSGPEAVYHLTWLGYSPLHYLPLAVARAGVLTIPDFILWDRPDYSTPELNRIYRAALEGSVAWAGRIVVYSRHVRDQVVARLGIPPGRIDVIPLAAGGRFGAKCDEQTLLDTRARVGGRFLLTVGKDYPHKNLKNLLQAFALANLQDTKLVIIGESAWPSGRDEIWRAARTAGIDDRLVVYDHVRDDLLPAFFQAADAFVFPSLEEGFGLPPLEAMASGIPVVCSDRASLPEVVGDAALLVNAADPGDLANAIRRVAEDQSLRSALIERGHERIRSFSWDRVAQETFESYQRALDTPSSDLCPPRPGCFVRYFPSDVPTITRALPTGPNSRHPRADCIVWLSSQSSAQPKILDPFSLLKWQAIRDWLQQSLAANRGVEVLEASDFSDQEGLVHVVRFASATRVVVVEPQPSLSPIELSSLPPSEVYSGVEVERWPLDDISDHLAGSGILSRSPDGVVQPPPNLATTVVSDALSRRLCGSYPMVAAFPTIASNPVVEPSDWISALERLGPFDISRSILVGDPRVAVDSTWLKTFRAYLRQFSPPKVPVWIGAAGNIATQVERLGGEADGDWMICPLAQLSNHETEILGQRPSGLNLTVTVGPDMSNMSVAALEGLVALAWGSRPNLVGFTEDTVATDASPEQAAIAEILAATQAGEGDIYAHSLRLQLRLREANESLRQMCEQALRSHLEGVKSYQEQIERHARGVDEIERAIVALRRRLSN